MAIPAPISETTEQALTWVRWITIIILLLLSMVEGVSDRAGIATWLLLLIFLLYNGAIDFMRAQVPALHHFQRAFIDLPLVAILYFCAAYTNGSIFVLYLLIVFCATTTMSLRGALQFTALAGATQLLIVLLRPLRLETQINPYVLIVQMTLVVFWGISSALLKSQVLEQQAIATRSTQEVVRLTSLGAARLRFIAAVAHDLRTPLTASRAGLGMLATHAADRLLPAEQHLLDNVRRNIEHLRLLTDDLLAFNLIENGAFHIEKAPLDLSPLLRTAVASLAPLFADKDQQCDLAIPFQLLYCGSAPRLEQAVLNLLMNAHRHTPVGTVITLTALTDAAHIQIAVSDTGPGLPRDVLETIGQRWQHVSASGHGSGLGLAIAGNIIALHGGTLRAENRPAGGATVVIELNTKGLA